MADASTDTAGPPPPPQTGGDDFTYTPTTNFDDDTFLLAALGWNRHTHSNPNNPNATTPYHVGGLNLSTATLSRHINVDFSGLAPDADNSLDQQLPSSIGDDQGRIQRHGAPTASRMELTLAEALAAPFYEGSKNIQALQSRLVEAGLLNDGSGKGSAGKGPKAYITGRYDEATKEAYARALLTAADAGPSVTVDDILSQKAKENAAAQAGGKITRQHGDSTVLDYTETGGQTLDYDAKKQATDTLGAQLGTEDSIKLINDVQSEQHGNQEDAVNARLAKNQENRNTNNTYSQSANSPAFVGAIGVPWDGFDPLKANRRVDNGWDLQADPNTQILAMATGHIENHHDASGYGTNYPVLIFDSPQNGRTGIYYGHIASDLADGTVVKMGDVIGHTLEGGPNAGNAKNLPGWLEIGFWGPNGPVGAGRGTSEGEAMKGALLKGRNDVPTVRDGPGAGADDDKSGDVPEAFVQAIAGQESSGGTDTSDSPVGAHGKYQIMPAYWKEWATEAGIPDADPNDPQANEQVAHFKLNQYFHQTGGDLRKVAAMWFSGSGDPNDDDPAHGDGHISIKAYADQVMARMGAGGAGTTSSDTSAAPDFVDANGNQVNTRYVGHDTTATTLHDSDAALIDNELHKLQPAAYDATKLDNQFQSFLKIIGSAGRSPVG